MPVTRWYTQTLALLQEFNPSLAHSERDLFRWANSVCLITDHEWIMLQREYDKISL